MISESRKLEKQAYYEKNRDKRIAYAKKYQKEHPKKARKYSREFYQRNKKVWGQYSKTRQRRLRAEKKQFIADWFLAHPYEYQIHRLEQVLKKVLLKRKRQAYWRKNTRIYRARRKDTFCNLSANQALELLTGCFFCGSKEDLALAHDIPVSKGGDTTKGNCFCLCRKCNSHMGDKDLSEMLAQVPLEI